MRKGLGLLVLVPILALLVTACGPQMATPTPQGEEVVKADPTGAHAEEGNPAEAAPESEEEEGQAPTEAPEEEPGSPPQDLPVDENDWRALGSPDAPVTIVEYSDFQ